VRARIRGPILDADLAAGMRPSASAVHLARADHLMQSRTRRRISDVLYRAIRKADAPPQHVTAEAPLSIPAIRACRDALKALANAVVTTENPRVQGVAIAQQLAFDGTGALYFQRNQSPERRLERLANTIRAALTALSVSGEFDRTSAGLRESQA
jgi:hypothetical protein